MRFLYKYFEEAPVDLFQPQRYNGLYSARESRLWHVQGRPVVTQDDRSGQPSEDQRSLAAGLEHCRYVIGAGPVLADRPSERDKAESFSYLTDVEKDAFNRLVGSLVGDGPFAIYLDCGSAPSKPNPLSPSTPEHILGEGARVSGREGVLAPASTERVGSALRRALSLSWVGEAFFLVGGALPRNLESGGLELVHAMLGPVKGVVPDYVAFHRVLSACDFVMTPVGGGEWGYHLGLYSIAPRRAEVERALQLAGEEVYRVEDLLDFNFNVENPPFEGPTVRRVGRKAPP